MPSNNLSEADSDVAACAIFRRESNSIDSLLSDKCTRKGSTGNNEQVAVGNYCLSGEMRTQVVYAKQKTVAPHTFIIDNLFVQLL